MEMLCVLVGAGVLLVTFILRPDVAGMNRSEVAALATVLLMD